MSSVQTLAPIYNFLRIITCMRRTIPVLKSTTTVVGNYDIEALGCFRMTMAIIMLTTAIMN